MALLKERSRIYVRGLGNFEILTLSPTPDTAFASVGYIKAATLNDENVMLDIVADDGNVVDYLSTVQKVGVGALLWQNTKEEVDLLKGSDGKLYALRYSGMTRNNAFQYFAMEQAKVNPSVKLPFVPGERLLPLDAVAVETTQSFPVPPYFQFGSSAEMLVDGLQLFVRPANSLNTETVNLLDMSGWARHGTVSADYASTIWQQTTTPFLPKEFLRFDGSNDGVSFGDILDDDASGDFAIDAWVRVQAADGTVQEIAGKISTMTGTTAGWGIYRSAANKFTFSLADGTTNTAVPTTTSITTNTWTHVAVSVDRNGNAQTYFNGAANGTPTSVSARTTGTNALNLYIGRDNTNYGQVDVGTLRIYRWIAGGLPTNFAAYMANHYNGEKADYGL